MNTLDKRLNAFRPDLADIKLQGKVSAQRFVEGMEAQVCMPVTSLYQSPDAQSKIDTQLLYGERLDIFSNDGEYSWVQSKKDGYVGYIKKYTCQKKINKSTHIVSAPRTFIYPQPDMKFPEIYALSMGSRVTITDEAETRGSKYSLLENGHAIFFGHLTPIDTLQKDYVSTAESLLHTPYLWGGNSSFGIDCSGLVQLSLMMTGIDVLRDTDMQESTIGHKLETDDQLKRGDLVFWKGHVAIMIDDQNIIHANGASMDIKIEPIKDAIERIASLYAHPTSYRRPL